MLYFNEQVFMNFKYNNILYWLNASNIICLYISKEKKSY